MAFYSAARRAGQQHIVHRRKALPASIDFSSSLQDLRRAVDVLFPGNVSGRTYVGGKIAGVFLLLILSKARKWVVDAT